MNVMQYQEIMIIDSSKSSNGKAYPTCMEYEGSCLMDFMLLEFMPYLVPSLLYSYVGHHSFN